MALKDTWVDKINGVDYNDADDINEIAQAVIELEKNDVGGTGEAEKYGGYYTPSVSQKDANTMSVSFTPSKADMPSVSPKNISLPKGDPYTLTEDDKTEIANEAAGLVELPIVQTKGDSETSVMSQKAISKTIFEYTENPLFVNVFDTVDISYGKILNTDGTVSDTTATLCVTDFINVTGGGVTIRTDDFPLYNGGSARIALYNGNKEKVLVTNLSSFANASYYYGDWVTDDNGHYIQFYIKSFPSTIGYIRICTNTTVVGNNPVLTIDEEIIYEQGYGSQLNKSIKIDHSQVMNTPQKNCWSILPNEHINIAYSQVNANGKAVKPINTLEHFIYVAENYGYNTLKCDVRPTSDGELILCHDAGFTFDGNGKITAYDSNNQTLIRNVTAATVLGYSHITGEHPCLVGDYLEVCRKYGKVAFITIRNEYMDVVIPKLISELEAHNMTYSTIINCMTYSSLVEWRKVDKDIMINYTLSYGANMDSAAIDKAAELGYCSLCGFGLSSSSTVPNTTCDFDYAREKGVRLLQAIAYKEGTAEDCYAMGYDGCQIGYAWEPIKKTYSSTEIDSMFGSYVNDIDALLGGE